MAKTVLVNDELWHEIQPMLPKKKRRSRYPGRFPIGDREVLTGILFVMKTGISWEKLPQEMGCGCGMTCWRRLRDWQRAGVWQAMLEVIFKNLDDQDRIDWSRVAAGSVTVRDRRKKDPVLSGGAISEARTYNYIHMDKTPGRQEVRKFI